MNQNRGADNARGGTKRRTTIRAQSVFLAGLLLGTGCAGMDVKPVSSGSDGSARGIRYYGTSTYVLVHTDNSGGLTTKILQLPDTTKKMSLRPYVVMASAETTLDFENGVLTKSVAKFDSTAVPSAVLKAAEQVAIAFANAAFNAPGARQSSTRVPPPMLFKLVVDNQEWKLNGGPGLGPDGQPMDLYRTIQPPGGS